MDPLRVSHCVFVVFGEGYHSGPIVHLDIGPTSRSFVCQEAKPWNSKNQESFFPPIQNFLNLKFRIDPTTTATTSRLLQPVNLTQLTFFNALITRRCPGTLQKSEESKNRFLDFQISGFCMLTYEGSGCRADVEMYHRTTVVPPLRKHNKNAVGHS